MFKSYKSSCISSINVNFHPRSAAAYVVVGCWAGSHPFKNESKKSSDCMFFLSVVTRHSCCKDVLMQKKMYAAFCPMELFWCCCPPEITVSQHQCGYGCAIAPTLIWLTGIFKGTSQKISNFMIGIMWGLYFSQIKGRNVRHIFLVLVQLCNNCERRPKN